MAVRARSTGSLTGASSRELLPTETGHAASGHAPPVVLDAAIEAFPEAVAEAFRCSRASALEHGFLAYAPAEPGRPLVPEPLSVGERHTIRWHWHARDATVAFSFHTHPGRDALCIPSGTDIVGALVRGEHVLYVLTMDGRLTGWRFRDAQGHPRTVHDAMRALEHAERFSGEFVRFLYDAFDALRPRVVTPVYAARVVRDDAGGCRFEPAQADESFFLPEERKRIR